MSSRSTLGNKKSPSKKSLLLPLSALVAVIGTGVLIFSFANQDGGLFRQPSSTPQAKISFIKNKKLESLVSRTHKLEQPIEVSIEYDKDQAVQAGEPYTLTGKIKSSVPLKNLNVKWALPKGVTAVSGQQQLSFSELKAGKEEVFDLTIITDSESNQKIHLFVESKGPGLITANSKQFNTQDQNLIEFESAQLHQKAVNYQGKKTKSQ